MSHAGFFFYTGDWIKDTRCLSLESRGAWIDLLCALSEAGGSITWPARAYDQYLGIIEREGLVYSAMEILKELSDLDICEVVTHANGMITVMSRRMTREDKDSESNRKRQERFRQRQKSNAHVTAKYNGSSSSESSSESSSHTLKSQNSASPGVSKSEKKKGENGMGTSMNLTPELKEQTDRLYNSDREKFKRIAAWVAQGRKHGYSEAVIAEALRRFWDYRMVDEWYPYLDTILTKTDKDLNRDEHDAEHRRHQEEVREASKMFLVK